MSTDEHTGGVETTDCLSQESIQLLKNMCETTSALTENVANLNLSLLRILANKTVAEELLARLEKRNFGK